MTKQTLTQAQCAAAFGVSYVTMQNWRRGIATRDKFPEVAEEKRTNPRQPEFPVTAVRQWAKRYGLEFARPLEDVMSTPRNAKPGPKMTTGKQTVAAKKASKHSGKRPRQ